MQGHGLKDADLPASLLNQIQNESNTNPTGKPIQFVGSLLLALWGILVREAITGLAETQT